MFIWQTSEVLALIFISFTAIVKNNRIALYLTLSPCYRHADWVSLPLILGKCDSLKMKSKPFKIQKAIRCWKYGKVAFTINQDSEYTSICSPLLPALQIINTASLYLLHLPGPAPALLLFLIIMGLLLQQSAQFVSLYMSLPWGQFYKVTLVFSASLRCYAMEIISSKFQLMQCYSTRFYFVSQVRWVTFKGGYLLVADKVYVLHIYFFWRTLSSYHIRFVARSLFLPCIFLLPSL